MQLQSFSWPQPLNLPIALVLYIRGHLDRLMAIVAIIFLSAFVASLQGRVLVEPENAAFYRQSGLRDLKRALEAPRFEGKAKNVIMFVGDGM